CGWTHRAALPSARPRTSRPSPQAKSRPWPASSASKPSQDRLPCWRACWRPSIPAQGRTDSLFLGGAMHIVHIHESFGGGTLTIVADIVRKTHSLGWKTTIFHGRRPETPADFRALFPQGTIFQRLHTGRQVNPVLDLFDTVRIAVY